MNAYILVNLLNKISFESQLSELCYLYLYFDVFSKIHIKLRRASTELSKKRSSLCSKSPLIGRNKSLRSIANITKIYRILMLLSIVERFST